MTIISRLLSKTGRAKPMKFKESLNAFQKGRICNYHRLDDNVLKHTMQCDISHFFNINPVWHIPDMEKSHARDPLTIEILARIQQIIESRPEGSETVYKLCINAGLNRRWYDDTIKRPRTNSPTITTIYKFMQAADITIYDIFSITIPVSDAKNLQDFVLEALKYQGELSPDEVARAVSRSYIRRHETNMTASELARQLDLLEPAAVREVSG